MHNLQVSRAEQHHNVLEMVAANSHAFARAARNNAGYLQLIHSLNHLKA